MRTLVVAAVLILLTTGSAPSEGQKTPYGTASGKMLEAKVRKAWEDIKNKNKDAFAAILTEDSRIVDEDGLGFRDKKSNVAEIDQLSIEQYTLSNFTIKPIGASGALVTYIAEYSGTYSGQATHAKEVFGEVWVRSGTQWKCQYVQGTNVK